MDNAPKVARAMLTRLASDRPDLIVLELGDGLLGLYGVAGILDDPDVHGALRAVVLAASDPVAAWGGVSLLSSRHGLATNVVTGPATDNAAGTPLVEEQTGVAARNARSDPSGLARIVVESLGLPWKEPAA